jgi:hypothetical protein
MPAQDTELLVANTNTNGDHDKFAHYAKASEITEAFVMGTEITALCGKKWVPTRDGNGFPLCQTCKEILDQLS